MAYTPNRGDVVWLDFDPQAGHEQSGRSLALVLSPQAYNGRTGLMVCCPLTTKAKGYPFEVATRVGGKQGVALSDQIKNLDWRVRNASFKCRITPEDAVDHVLAKLGSLLFS
jgi:mRNA interferase MazF